VAVTGLFAGIGGFELAFKRAGFETNLLVELDPAAQAVLKARFPKIPIGSDVSDLRKLPEDTEILTAGFPCQNLSMAGDKTGISGKKSGVVERMFELIELSRVPLVVIENVYFMLHLDSGRAMKRLAKKFEDLGYKWAYRVLNTIGFGLPQRRRRVYFVASLDLDPRRILFADESPSQFLPKPNLDKPLGFYWTEGRSGIGLTADGIPPLKVGSALGIPSSPAVLFTDGAVLMPSIKACERLQGFPVGWTSKGRGIGGRAPEWRLIGNAVSVPVAQWVAQRIKKPGDLAKFEQSPFSRGQRWPNAAWNVGDGRIEVAATDRPVATTVQSIESFRDSAWKPLSERALNGFLRRVELGELWTPRGFLPALRKASRKASKVDSAR